MFVSASRPLGLARGYKRIRDTAPDAIYLNSFFDVRMSMIPQLLARLGFWRSAKVLLAPRGEFNTGALAIRRNKKRLFLSLYRLLGLQRKVTWHASSDIEAKAVRALWGAKARILVREDETNLPEKATPPVPHDGALRVIFLGRIVPIKGLLTALDALALSTKEISFDIYGPEEDIEYVAKCREAAARAPANVVINFRGALAPDSVRSTLLLSDVMVMPTQGENFGHVIAEALSVSCPVICSGNTPWSQVLAAGGGVVVESTRPQVWLEAIEEFAVAQPSERLLRRDSAGVAYDAWRKAPKGEHVLTTLERLYA